MAEQFTPRQLDQLEDALERLETSLDEAGGSLLEDPELELDLELRERLGEYEQVLALCRDAFPLEDPPEGLLDEVLAEAREVSRQVPVREVESRGGFSVLWQRWRDKLVPTFALAGTAALVLLLLEPAEPEPIEMAERSEYEAKRDDTKRAEPSDTSKEASASKPAPLEPDEERDEELDEVDEAGLEPEPATKLPEPVERKRTSPSKSAGKPAIEPEPAPAQPPVEPLSKDDTWRVLERANTARLAGNCSRARELYEQVIAASSDSLGLARAKAGIGLCLEQARDSAAEQWFDQARSHSAGVDSWIRQQRDAQSGEKKSATKSKKLIGPESDSPL